LTAAASAQVTPELALPAAPAVGHYHTDFLPTSINLDPDLTRAYKLLLVFKFDEARNILEPLARHPRNSKALRSEAWCLIGYTYLNNRQGPDALEALNEALKIDPSNATAHYFLANEHFLDGQTARMQEALKKAIELRPAFISALRLLAESYADTGQTAQAVEYYQKIVALLPHSGYYRFQLYRSELQDGRYPQAERDLRTLIALEPEFFTNYTRLGDLYLAWHDRAAGPDEERRLLEAAHAAYKTAVMKEPRDFRAHLGLASTALLRDNPHSEVRAHAERAQQLAPSSPEVESMLARLERLERERSRLRTRRLAIAGGGTLLLFIVLGAVHVAERRHYTLGVLTRFNQKADAIRDLGSLQQFCHDFLSAELALVRSGLWVYQSRDNLLTEQGPPGRTEELGQVSVTREVGDWLLHLRKPIVMLPGDAEFDSIFPGLSARLLEKGYRAVVPLREGAVMRGFLALGWEGGRRRARQRQDLLVPLSQLIAQAMERLHLVSSTLHDEMTGLYNRRGLFQSLSMEFRRADRYHLPCSLVLFDIDDFKRINDLYGHAQGDRVLTELAELVRRSLRDGIDLAARSGGEEFCLVLPATSLERAVATAERILEKCRDHRFSGFPKPHPVTLSIGVATYPDHAEDEDELLRLADEAQYLAKRQGKNRVCPAGEVKPSEMRGPSLARGRDDELNITDRETGLYSSGYLALRLSDEIHRAARSREPLCLAVLAPDAADQDLRRLALLLRQGIREGIDIPARLEGHQLALLFPCTDLQNGFFVAERLRHTAEVEGIPLSAGVAGYPVHSQHPQALLEAALEAQRRARADGNSVFCAPS